MKKILALFTIIVVVLSFSLIACQKQEAPKEEAPVVQPAPTAPPAGGYGETEQKAPETPGYGEKKPAAEPEGKAGGY